MLLYHLSVLSKHFSRGFIIKDNANNGQKPPSCPVPVIGFTNEEITVCINQEAIGAINEAAVVLFIAPRNPPSCFLFHNLLFFLHHQLIDLIFIVTLRF